MLHTPIGPDESVSDNPPLEDRHIIDSTVADSRMQTIQSSSVTHPSTLSILRMTVTKTGFKSLYTGLSASVMRQMSYSLVRLGTYEKMKAHLSRDGPAPASHLFLAAMAAGALGGIAGNPAGECHAAHGMFSAKRTPIQIFSS